jgi:hypothetical protein
MRRRLSVSERTPGDWSMTADGLIQGSLGEPVARLVSPSLLVGSLMTWEANGRLIKAAPDLLKAAKLTALHFERMNLHPDVNFMGDDEHEAWSALRTAIAKAEGR